MSPMNGDRSRSPRKNGPEKSLKRESSLTQNSHNDLSSRGSNSSSKHKDVRHRNMFSNLNECHINTLFEYDNF